MYNNNPPPNDQPPYPPLGGQAGAVEHQGINPSMNNKDGPVMEDMVPNWDVDAPPPALCVPVVHQSQIIIPSAEILPSTATAAVDHNNKPSSTSSSSPPTNYVPKTKRRSCNFPNCTRYAQRHGVCCKHGANLKKKQCSHPNCTNQAKKGGICVKHGAKIPLCQWIDPVTFETCPNHAKKSGVCRRHGARVVEKTCKFDGCSNHIQAHGLCIRHGAPVKKCTFGAGCVNKVQKEGLCKRHLTLRDKLAGIGEEEGMSSSLPWGGLNDDLVPHAASSGSQHPQLSPPSYKESLAQAVTADAESSREKQHEVKEVPLSVLHAALGLTSLHNNTGGKSPPTDNSDSPKTTNRDNEPSSLIVRSSTGGLIVGNREKDAAVDSRKVHASDSTKKGVPVSKVDAAKTVKKRSLDDATDAKSSATMKKQKSVYPDGPPQDNSLHHYLTEARRFYSGINGKADDSSADTIGANSMIYNNIIGANSDAKMRRAITDDLNDQMAQRLKYYPEYRVADSAATKMSSAAATSCPTNQRQQVSSNQQLMASLEERVALFQKLASLPTSTIAKMIPTGGGYTYPPASANSIAAASGRRDDDNMGVVHNMLLPSQLPPVSLGGMMGMGGQGGGASRYNPGGISQPPPSYETSIGGGTSSMNRTHLPDNLQMLYSGGDIPTRLTNLTNPEMANQPGRPRAWTNLAFGGQLQQHQANLARQEEATNAAWAKLAEQQLAAKAALAKLARQQQEVDATDDNYRRRMLPADLAAQAREAMAKGWIKPGSGKNPSVGYHNRKSNDGSNATEKKNGSDGLWDLEGAMARFQQSSSPQK